MSDTRPECPQSQRVDGPLHSWRFDGDDPYVVCSFCGERRDARTGRVIRPKDTTTLGPRPELREQAIAHIAWLRRDNLSSTRHENDNRESADYLERLVAVAIAFADKVEQLRAERDRLAARVQVRDEAIADVLAEIDRSAASGYPCEFGQVQVDALRALVAPDPTSPTDTGDTT